MKQILIFLQGYLLGRSGSTFVGLFLLLSLVWWGGPYVGLESGAVRLAVMAALVGVAGALWLLRMWKVRRGAARFRKELQGEGGSAPERQLEIAELKEKMDAAISALKSSGLGVGYRGNAALYALPWFMIIGPAAAGKTTLLRNSGLHFPYAHGDDADIKGFGGTRNCDWWFSDEAVILDTAGRYTTEDDDREEWVAFLDLLRRHRSRVPVNGVMVALSLAELLTCDSAGNEWHVKVIRDRLDELINHLGCNFPIYLVVTKCDLLHGFTSFFEDLSEHDRSQVWGAWLLDEGENQDLAASFEKRLQQLQGRLNELRLRRLSIQRKFELKHAIFDFPNQFQVATDKLQEFFNLLVKENPYQETPRFCGVYLTSGTQEGTPIQRIVGNLRQAFGYVEDAPPDDPGMTKSFFIKKLFQEAIFPNANGIVRNRRKEILNCWLKSAWVATGLAVIVGSVLLLSASLTSNTLLAGKGSDSVRVMIEEVVSGDRNQERSFSSILSVYRHYRKLRGYQERLPVHLLLGIYQGEKQLEPTLTALLDSLDLVFFKPSVTSLEYRLENFARQWDGSDDKGQEKIREPYYQALKTYLMLSMPERLSAEFAAPVLAETWCELISRGGAESEFKEAERQDMEEMILLYLAYLKRPVDDPLAVRPWKRRKEIVARSREQLRTPPNAERLYAQILNKGKISLKDRKLEEFIKGHGYGVLLCDHVQPGVYTARGWTDFVQPEIKKVVTVASRGDWVIGYSRDGEGLVQENAADAAAEVIAADAAEGAEPDEGTVNSKLALRLEREIRQYYFRDYADAWFSLLESVRYAPFTSVADASKKMLVIAQSDGPIGELMRVLSSNVNLEDPPESEPGVSLEKLAQGGGDYQARRSVPELEETLRDLRKFADPAEKMTVSLLINQYLLAISSVQNEMERLGASVNVQREANLYAAKILTGSGGDLELYKSWVSTSSMLNGIEPRTRKLASGVLIGAIRNAWGAVLSEADQDLQLQWKNSVVSPYERKLQGKFPFAGNGSDAALADVADFFRPHDGIFWSFVRNNLAPFVSEGQGEWRKKTWLDLGPGFSKELMISLSRSNVITAGLFRRGSDEPNLQFYLYPMPSRGLSETMIESNGQSYRYRNEPQEWRKFLWPGNGEGLGAKIQGVSGRSAARGELNYEGIWGLFHLLQKGKITQESGNQYLGVWEFTGSDGAPLMVQFKIKADRENNVFDRKVLSGYALPESLF
jgi:type VI secretion system protein ImpL